MHPTLQLQPTHPTSYHQSVSGHCLIIRLRCGTSPALHLPQPNHVCSSPRIIIIILIFCCSIICATHFSYLITTRGFLCTCNNHNVSDHGTITRHSLCSTPHHDGSCNNPPSGMEQLHDGWWYTASALSQCHRSYAAAPTCPHVHLCCTHEWPHDGATHAARTHGSRHDSGSAHVISVHLRPIASCDGSLIRHGSLAWVGCSCNGCCFIWTHDTCKAHRHRLPPRCYRACGAAPHSQK